MSPGEPPTQFEAADIASHLGHHRFMNILMDGTSRRMQDTPWAGDARRPAVRADERDEIREQMRESGADAPRDPLRDIMRDGLHERPVDDKGDKLRELRCESRQDKPREQPQEPRRATERDTPRDAKDVHDLRPRLQRQEPAPPPETPPADWQARPATAATVAAATRAPTRPDGAARPGIQADPRTPGITTAAARGARPAAQRPGMARSAEASELTDRAQLDNDTPPWRLAGLNGPAPAGWTEHLAQRIGELCGRAGPAIHSWQVTVPLDPNVLPETQLHMALSPDRLALRFQTQSSYSHALVSEHEPQLVRLLHKALPSPRHIDVETT